MVPYPMYPTQICHDAVSMVAHEGLEILAELLQPMTRDPFGKWIEESVQSSIVEALWLPILQSSCLIRQCVTI